MTNRLSLRGRSAADSSVAESVIPGHSVEPIYRTTGRLSMTGRAASPVTSPVTSPVISAPLRLTTASLRMTGKVPSVAQMASQPPGMIGTWGTRSLGEQNRHQYEWIGSQIIDHAEGFDTTPRSQRPDYPRLSSQPGGGNAGGSGIGTLRSYTFSLIRVAPFRGVNPFEHQSVRREITLALKPTPPQPDQNGGGLINTCTPGQLATLTALPFISFAAAYIDIDPASMSLSLRNSATVNTALTVTLPSMDTTRFAIGSGWQAVIPALPLNFAAGVPAQTFIVKRGDSGDFYRLTLGFIGTSQIIITEASGECCGPGGCP
jgi:hypothetical protein